MNIERPVVQFFKTECGKLFRHTNSNMDSYMRMDIVGDDKRVYTKDEFESLSPKKIKREVYSRLMNEFFKDVEHTWTHNGHKYKKLPNFQATGYSLCSNYVIGKDIPLHTKEDMPDLIRWQSDGYILVYHWGRVYLHTISYNGYKQGQLIDIRNGDLVRWAQLKHCAPIFDITSNKIV